MTVCIAAICDDGKTLVLGADREITAGGISLKFDHGEKKFEHIIDNCYVMSSGDAFLCYEIRLMTFFCERNIGKQSA